LKYAWGDLVFVVKVVTVVMWCAQNAFDDRGGLRSRCSCSRDRIGNEGGVAELVERGD
jgi:hypothetical protein